MAYKKYASAVNYNSIGEFSSDSYFARNPYFDEPIIRERKIKKEAKCDKEIKVKSHNRVRNESNVNKGKMIFSIVCVGVVLILIVLLSAYAADLRNINNKLVKENTYIQSEIDSLNIRIGEASKIEYIEDVAINELGMVYPDPDKCIYVSNGDMPSGSLANLIKQEAYN
jgi:cell division protein FtsL